MRSVTLARVAAQAELLRLRRLARRQAMRAAFASVAVVFLVAALVGGHVAAAMALTTYVQPIYAVLILAAVDLVIAVILLLVAARNTPDQIEREALQVRLAAQEPGIE